MIDTALLGRLEEEIAKYSFPKEPENLYAPLDYIINLGGKRLRPLLTLLGCELFGGDVEKAIKPALAIEMFHNFSLIHDDIMDEAPLRRGQQTVHEKWNRDIAILSGDALLVEAYQLISEVEPSVLPKVLEVFSTTAKQVCEGQQYDMDFETMDRVEEADYISMIQYKTSVLLGCALKVGALIAGADDVQSQKLYDFGLYMGTSFQIKDDYLDAFGDPEKFGKQIGGDILANKKTILLINALENASGDSLNKLEAWLKTDSSDGKVESVKSLYRELNVDQYAVSRMNEYYDLALGQLEQLQVEDTAKQKLYSFTEWLHKRDM